MEYNCTILPEDRSEFIPHTLFPPAGAQCNCAGRFIHPVKINPSWKKSFKKRRRRRKRLRRCLVAAGFGSASWEKCHSAGSNRPPLLGDLPTRCTLACCDGYPGTHKQPVRWTQGLTSCNHRLSITQQHCAASAWRWILKWLDLFCLIICCFLTLISLLTLR